MAPLISWPGLQRLLSHCRQRRFPVRFFRSTPAYERFPAFDAKPGQLLRENGAELWCAIRSCAPRFPVRARSPVYGPQADPAVRGAAAPDTARLKVLQSKNSLRSLGRNPRNSCRFGAVLRRSEVDCSSAANAVGDGRRPVFEKTYPSTHLRLGSQPPIRHGVREPIHGMAPTQASGRLVANAPSTRRRCGQHVGKAGG